MAQTDRAVWLWETILTRMEFDRLIEIGTYKGNFSFFLFLYCIQRKKEFITYDIRNWQELDHKAHLKNRLNFNESFKKKSIFDDLEFLKLKIQESGVSVVFCDGGNKVKEFNVLSSFLKKGDVIAVHDYKTEVDPAKLILKNFHPLFQNLCFQEGMTMFYEKYV